MKTQGMISLLGALLAVCIATSSGQAQAGKNATKAAPAPARPAVVAKETETATVTPADAAAAESVEVAPADTVHKKHGGLFGKVKGVAKNKVVQQVAKVAACTMIPGGQVVAGAIDAASTKGTAGAAQGVSGAATGSSCMPGVGGAAMQPAISGQVPPGLGATTEAPGQTVDVSTDLAAELGKGKTTLRNFDWIAGAPGISPAGTPSFIQAMTQLAAAMSQGGGSYRLDLYLDNRYQDAIAKTLGPERLSTVEAALTGALGATQAAPALEIGKSKRDKHPRLEIVKRK
ncbi:MAG: hypothetical protein ACJ8DC_11070 [Gemmatimonadales bacterium]